MTASKYDFGPLIWSYLTVGKYVFLLNYSKNKKGL